MSPTTDTIEELRDWLTEELHVLVIMISNAWGGLEQVALNDVRMLMQSGFKVTFLVQEGSPIAKVIKADSPQIKLVHCPNKVRNFLDLGLFRQIRDLVDNEGINLVHCHQTSILGAVVPPLMGRPHVALVVTRHILNSHNKRDPVHAIIYRRIDYLLVLSQTMKRNLAATFPIPEKKLRVVNLAIDLDKFNPNLVDKTELRRQWGIPENAFLVGVVGRLDPQKGQDLLIKALAQVRKTCSDVYGIMVGNETPGLDGSYLEELKKGVADLHLADYVFIKEGRSDVAPVMAALDLFVMPSWSFPF